MAASSDSGGRIAAVVESRVTEPSRLSRSLPTITVPSMLIASDGIYATGVACAARVAAA